MRMTFILLILVGLAACGGPGPKPEEERSCSGSVGSCSGGSLTCEDKKGCNWSPDWFGGVGAGDCGGTPKPCYRYDDDSECERQPGCSWE